MIFKSGFYWQNSQRVTNREQDWPIGLWVASLLKVEDAFDHSAVSYIPSKKKGEFIPVHSRELKRIPTDGWTRRTVKSSMRHTA